MPVVTIVAVIAFVMATFSYFGENNNGVEFFVETEPESAIVYVRARGNLSIAEQDALVRRSRISCCRSPASAMSSPLRATAG
jgi:multidrug efflux pump